MEKLIRDGLVGVLYSPKWGAGWSTWNDDAAWMAMDRRLVECFESNGWQATASLAKEIAANEYGGQHTCVLGAEDLEIKWLPIGTAFYIDEFDGNESVVTSDIFTMTA